MPVFTIQLTDDEFKAIHQLASARNTRPNNVIQQALATEKLLAEHMRQGDELLIKKPNGSFQKVIFRPPPKK